MNRAHARLFASSVFLLRPFACETETAATVATVVRIVVKIRRVFMAPPSFHVLHFTLPVQALMIIAGQISTFTAHLSYLIPAGISYVYPLTGNILAYMDKMSSAANMAILSSD